MRTRRPTCIVNALWCALSLYAIDTCPQKGVAFEVSAAQQLKLGKTIHGSIISQPPRFAITDQGNFPQKIYRFSHPATNMKGKPSSDEQDMDVLFSTCVQGPTELPTLQNSIIFIFKGSDFQEATPQFPVTPIAESVRDCDGEYATVEFRGQTNSEYVVVVSSTSGQHGHFRLESRLLASPPTPTPLPWGLDRIDQRKLPLDGKYSVPGISGKNVFVYVVDSGVRVSHKEFTRRNGAPNAFHGLDTVERLDYAADCTGHGTHVAAVIAGFSFGVAKDATIISVRVIGCDGKGLTSRVLEGLEFVREDTKKRNRYPAVVSMSISTHKSEAINAAVRQLTGSGIPVVTAAGNTEEDSCGFSPASEPTSITVAASNKDDTRPKFSNTGNCVDMFAPGHDVLSAWSTGDNAHKIQSGTSAACPHVAGAIAVLLSVNPKLPATAVASMIYSASTYETVANHSAGVKDTQSARVNNRLLYLRPIPSKGLARPNKGYVFVYAVLQLSIGNDSCKDSWSHEKNRFGNAEKNIAKVTSASQKNVKIVLCCQGKVDNSFCGEVSNSNRISLRIKAQERLASNSFNALDEGLKGGSMQKEIAKALETREIRVEVEPWVVDSHGNIFWTAPDLRGEQGAILSRGALIAIVSCTSALSLAMGICLLICIRNKRENKKFANYLESIENYTLEKESHEAIHPISLFDSGSPREVKYRENTALQGDILMNLPSTASLHSPRAREEEAKFCRGSSRQSLSASFLQRFPFSQRQTLQGPSATAQRTAANNDDRLTSSGQEKLAQTPRGGRGFP